MKSKKVYILIILFILFVILILIHLANKDDYRKIFSMANDKKIYNEKEEVDITKYTYDYDKNELGIPENQLMYLSPSIGGKGELNSDVIELDKKDAISDVNFLFDLLKYSYAGYSYFGGDNVWGESKANIINDINLHDNKISSKELEKMIFNNMQFIQDGHFTINFKSPLKHYNFYYSEKFKIDEDKNGYYIKNDNIKWYIKSINNSYNIEDYIKLSINKEGELCKYIGFLDNGSYNNIKVVLQSKDIYKDIYIKLNSNYNKNSYYNGKEKMAYKYDEINDIPIFTMKRMYNIDSNDNSVELFSESANKAKNEDVIILDIRGNNGGSDIAPIDWFVNFIGEAPQVQRTSIKLASLINNHITKIAAKNIDYENLSIELKEEYNKELEIANSKENKWYISSEREKMYKNKTKIFVIIDNKVASSGENFLSYLDTLENVVFVGTNTSGSMLSNSFIQCVLPNSKINISYGNVLTLNNDFIEGKGFEPDLWVAEDDVVERILKLIG